MPSREHPRRPTMSHRRWWNCRRSNQLSPPIVSACSNRRSLVSWFSNPPKQIDRKLWTIWPSKRHAVRRADHMRPNAVRLPITSEPSSSNLTCQLNRENEGTKQKIEEVDVNRAEAPFKFEPSGVIKFFEDKCISHYSDTFWCRGLQWSTEARRHWFAPLLKSKVLKSIHTSTILNRRNGHAKWTTNGFCSTTFLRRRRKPKVCNVTGSNGKEGCLSLK